MSLSIWTRCGGLSNAAPLQAHGVRAVESQYVNSTRKLVDTDEEQALLEALIDRVKPPVPVEIAGDALHYLLFTPFRHPPLRNGSRLGTRVERGIFYGALEVPTALAEVAYYRLIFLNGSEADLGLVETPLTVFSFRVKAKVAIDLTAAPFSGFRKSISSPTDYTASQRLGREMREAGVEVVRYHSARDPEGGINLALFTPKFASKRPERSTQAWHCNATKERVELRRRDPLGLVRGHHAFPKAAFLVNGELPSPAT